MEKPNIYLSPAEMMALQMLAEDRSYGAVQRDCGIPSLKFNAKEVQRYLTAHAQAMEGPGPSALQLEAMQRHFGVGHENHTQEAVASRMGVSTEEAVALFNGGLAAAGIFATDGRERRVQGRIYLASQLVLKKALPLSDNHLQVLRLYAIGLSDDAIASETGLSFTYVDALIREGCQRLGTVARGRGVQRRLVAIALARREGNPPVTMDDPAF
jgi:ATP/maltotriose-dependent transcriptional regulator MalT